MYAEIISAPADIQVTFSEKSLIISWDSVPDADGYNVYNLSSPLKQQPPKYHKKKLNSSLVRSGTHFTYLWENVSGKKVRNVKGYSHTIAVTSVLIKGKDTLESSLSRRWTNKYFKGYSKVDDSVTIMSILKQSQVKPFLPVAESINTKASFLRFMTAQGKSLHNQIKNAINPLATGGCAPISTIAVKLMKDCGITAYRAEGTFISEYHAFAIVNIDNVEYVLDFAADQFIPDVSPVLIPRDQCYLNSQGEPDTTGVPIYQIDRVYNADQVDLSQSNDADVYRKIYDTAKKRRN